MKKIIDILWGHASCSLNEKPSTRMGEGFSFKEQLAALLGRVSQLVIANE